MSEGGGDRFFCSPPGGGEEKKKRINKDIPYTTSKPGPSHPPGYGPGLVRREGQVELGTQNTFICVEKGYIVQVKAIDNWHISETAKNRYM